MRIKRSSGVLLHPTSLPGPFGIGDFGPEARRFVDYLAAAGQSFWNRQTRRRKIGANWDVCEGS